MMEEVVVSGNSTLPSPQKLDFERKTDYSGEKENLVKSASQEGLKKGGKEFAESASNIEEARSKAGILKTNEGQEVKGRPVEKKVKQIGASGNEEIVTKLRGRNQGIGKSGVTTKGIEDVSNIETKLLRGTGTLLKETSELIDFAYLSKAFATGNVDDLINAFPLGMVTQAQIAQFEEVSTQVGITRLGNLLAEGASPLEIRDFLESKPELKFMVIFANNKESSLITDSKKTSLRELYDPFGNENQDNAFLINIDITQSDQFIPITKFKK